MDSFDLRHAIATDLINRSKDGETLVNLSANVNNFNLMNKSMGYQKRRTELLAKLAAKQNKK